MTTSFPTGLDALTNPAAGDPTTSPSHSAQHANVNDAVEAIEAKVGIDASTDLLSHDRRLRSRNEVHATTTFTNSTAENTLFTFTVPQNEPKAGDVYRLTMWGRLFNNSAGAITYTYRFKFGGTTTNGGPALSITQNALQRGWRAVYEIMFETTAAERTFAHLICTATGVDGGGLAAFGTSETLLGFNSAAVDSTSASRAIAFTCQMGTADANGSIDLRVAVLERIKGLTG